MTGRPRTARRFPRVPFEAPLFVEQLSDGDFQGFARTRVLAEGGCMFLSPTRVGYLSLLKLSISLGQEILTADARVAYERLRPGREMAGEPLEVEIGVEFLRLSPADRAYLRALCGSPEQNRS